MVTSYTLKEQNNFEAPIPDLSTLPSEERHRTPDGSIHLIKVGLRMVEESGEICKVAVEEDPLREYWLKIQLGDNFSLSQFNALLSVKCVSVKKVTGMLQVST